MSQSFECAWESVRPVPHVTIDFGDGRKLERTLHGNVVTYFCTSSGEVFDLLPGLVDAREYMRRLDQATRLRRAMAMEPMRAPSDPTQPTDWHGTRTRAAQQRLAQSWHEALAQKRGREALFTHDPIQVFDGSKFRVEHKLDLSLVPLADHDAESLRQDTRHNRSERYPLASQLWLEHPLAQPREITGEVYRRLLNVDLDDPYLGLAPDVLGGEIGRR